MILTLLLLIKPAWREMRISSYTLHLNKKKPQCCVLILWTLPAALELEEEVGQNFKFVEAIRASGQSCLAGRFNRPANAFPLMISVPTEI